MFTPKAVTAMAILIAGATLLTLAQSGPVDAFSNNSMTPLTRAVSTFPSSEAPHQSANHFRGKL